MSNNLEKFNEFYKLKRNYENQLDKFKASILKNPSLSWREKRSEFRKLKPKCIKCNRPVGSIFSIKMDKQIGSRHLKATCGDLVEPCDFWIDYIVPETTLYTNNMTNFEHEILNLKNDVIDAKNKLLFGYITSETAVEEFDKLKEMINDSSSFLEYFIDRFSNIANNKAKIELINSLKTDINNTYINNIKIAIENFNKTNDEQFVKDAVDIYVNILKPKLNELRELEFKKSYVEFNPDTDTYILVQNKYQIEDIEFGDEIIVNEKGKVKPSSINEEKVDGENIETKYGVKMDKSSLIINTNNFTLNNEQVVWDNPDYQKVWNTLSNKYKRVLANDTDWMVQTMDAYVNGNKNENMNDVKSNINIGKDSDLIANKEEETYIKARKNIKQRVFIRPPGLIIPPKNIGEDKYDFGNDLYNDVFNKLPVYQQNTLLTLYSKKNGVINYEMLEDALDNIMMAHLEISKY